ARLTENNSHVILATRSGRAIRFHEDKVREMGRNATGVRGITLDDENDRVIGMITTNQTDVTILVVSEQGYGKRSHLEDYRITDRGGKGVKTMNITEKTGQLINIMEVVENDDLMIITKEGQTIRMSVKEIPETSRNTQGVRLIRIKEGDETAAIAKLAEGGSDTSTDASESTEQGELFD
ncbi:MAG: DNA gyrase subunit A, partial [Bacteroidia bacterium]|nr:DNA gyrase subunit A [Bacteroidia bacterium]